MGFSPIDSAKVNGNLIRLQFRPARSFFLLTIANKRRKIIVIN